MVIPIEETFAASGGLRQMGNKILNNVKTVALMGILSSIILLAGHLIGGTKGITVALFIAVATNFVGYFFSAKIALMSMRAQEVGPGHPLYDMTAKLVQRANMPMPKVYVSPEQAPNAFATGRNPKHAAVCATEGLLRLLSPNEVAGVMAHELAHVKHRDILISTIAATLGTVISYLGYMFMFSGSNSDEEEQSPFAPIALLLIMILGPIAATIIQLAISRQREYAADTEGAAICGDPMYLATALEKVHAYAHQIPMNAPPAMNALMIAEPKNLMGSVAGLFQTHPPLEKRLQNLIGRESSGMFR
jgi:heat shock protein HtpX